MRRMLIVLLAVAACHGKRAGKDFFGTQVSPPGVLAQIRPGMTLAQVKAIAPEAKDDPGKGLLVAKPASNVKLYVGMDRDLVDHTYVSYDGDDGMAVLTQAWGPPDKEPDRGDLHEVVWRSTATGWRATVFCGNGTDQVKLPPFCTITFHPHLPVETMFAKPLAPPGDFAKAKPRMTLAQLKAATHVPQLTDTPTQSVIRWLAYDGAVEHVDIRAGRLDDLDYSLPVSARAAIEKAWGAPSAREGDREVWFDANAGWSAVLDKDASDPQRLRLVFAGFQPLLAQVALLETLVAAPTAADAKRSHPELEWDAEQKTDDQPVLWLSDNEYVAPAFRAARSLTVSLFGNSVAVTAVMGFLDPAREPAIVDALTEKWGAPKKTVKGAEIEYRFGKHGVLVHQPDLLTLHVGPDA